MKKEFEFEIDYYKPSGKWYANERFKMEVAPCLPLHHKIPYNPRDVFYLTFGPGRKDLPGLSGKTWEGYAVLAHIETFRDGNGEATERRLGSYLMDWSNIYEWHDRALALPGAPEIWAQAAEGEGLVAMGGRLGLYGIASDGTWWEPTGRSDRPWVLVVDHPATEGVLLRLIGAGVFGFWMAEKWKNSESEKLGQSCIRVAEMIGKWPRGGA